jgi:hypothetical protein
MGPCNNPDCCNYVSEAYKHHVLQSMIDHLDYENGLQPLKREVIIGHLVPRKMSYCEFKQDIMIPMLLVGCAGVLLKLFL